MISDETFDFEKTLRCVVEAYFEGDSDNTQEFTPEEREAALQRLAEAREFLRSNQC